jgi:hypothetical protein
VICLPVVTGAKKPGDFTHEVDLKVLLDGLSKHAFNIIIGTGIGEIVHIDAEEKGRLARNEGATEDTGIVLAGSNADGNESIM